MLLLFVDCSTLKFFMLFSILALLKIYAALKKKEANVLSMQAKVTQSTDAIHVSIKIMTTIILELPLQLCLFSLLALKLANGEFAVYCQSIFKQTQSTNVIHVSFKIMAPIILELPLHLCLFLLLALKLANAFAVYCQSIFLFVLPMTVCSSLIFILLK